MTSSVPQQTQPSSAASDRDGAHGQRSDWSLYKRFWPFVQPYRRMLMAGLALVPAVVVLDLARPYILKLGIDDYIQAGDTTGLLGISAALLGVVLGAYALGGVQTYLLSVAALRGIGDLRQRTYRHIMGQGAAFFDRHPTGSLLTRTTSDIESLGETLMMGSISIISDVLYIVGILATMLWLDWKLTLLTFAVSPALVLVVNHFRKQLKRFSVAIRKALSRLNGYFAESLAGLKVIKLFGREDKSHIELKRLNYAYLDAYRRSNWYEASLYAIMDGMANLCVAVMLWYGGLRHLDDANPLTLGLLVAFVEYISRLFVPVRELSGNFATLQRAVAALERIFGLLDTHHEIGAGRELSPTRPDLTTPTIEFKDVRFAYRADAGDVLHGVSFSVATGRVVALVGATGSGKTTVGKLLTRQYDGYRGNILLGGEELRDLPPALVRGLVGVVHQDVFIFAGTVHDNISLQNPNISREKVVEAAKLVNAHAFISELPGTYDALLTERGSNLSSGQAQLLAFARAMAHDPPILVLDEATAHIDSGTEQLIQAAIEKILALKTVLIVAHRLSTIQRADEILVMDRGLIIERGTHAELLAVGGRYAQLHRDAHSTGAAAENSVGGRLSPSPGL